MRPSAVRLEGEGEENIAGSVIFDDFACVLALTVKSTDTRAVRSGAPEKERHRYKEAVFAVARLTEM